MTGTVYLVGAGPGDPGLLTIAGRDALVKAEVVFYDRLAHPSLLGYAPKSAERIFVGKQSATHFVRQEDTNFLMADQALAGKTVVRLKGGDPFVFGRGGEEAEYLRERGVPFVIVPGISSAIAAPAYAGIPVTHRDAASSFAVITGHERDDKHESGTRTGGAAEQRRRWDRIAWAADTLVFLMGVESLSEISARLIENGRDATTPIALVQWGTWTQQRVVTGTLETIVEIVREAGITAPAVTIIGDVVNWRDRLRWFDTGPLFGRRILVTRAREQVSELSERLRSLGAEPVEFPTIRIAPPADDYEELDDRLGHLSYDWIVFTSANGVSHTFDRLSVLGGDARWFRGAKIAAIGPATAAALTENGIRADFTPTEFVAEAVLAQFPEKVNGKRLLLPRAAEAREVLPETWRAQGAIVDVVPAYQTLLESEGADTVRKQLAGGDLDAITFTSSSTVRNFVEAMGGTVTVPEATRLIAIGPVTAETCRELLRAPDHTSDSYTIDGLVETLVSAFPTAVPLPY
ncbi:MAG: uroporphyrinogen-III C-methyltransferase [Cytophagales bacterium]|nr:uroporphyrinogen-III C-methyltransferase [Armatimonadota bacterium]